MVSRPGSGRAISDPLPRLRFSVQSGPRPRPADPGTTPPQPGGGLPERICPVESFSIVPRSLAGGLVSRLSGGDVTERRILRDAGAADCAFPCSRAPGRGLRTLAQTPRQPGGGLPERICPVEPFSIVPRSLAGGFGPAPSRGLLRPETGLPQPTSRHISEKLQ